MSAVTHIQAAVLTSVAHSSRILTGFLVLKLIAIYLGVDGMGAIGHFMTAVTVVSLLAGGGIINGIMKYSAEYQGRPKVMLRFMRAFATYSLYASIGIFVVGTVFSVPIAELVFGRRDWFWLIIILSCAQFLIAFMNAVVGVANGVRQTHVYAKIQIVGSVVTIPVAWVLISTWGFVGGVLALTVAASVAAVPAFVLFLKSPWWGRVRAVSLTRREWGQLGTFTGMIVVSAATMPISEAVLRQALIERAGLDAAGIWQSSMRLAGAYLGFFGVFLSFYFMPLVATYTDRAAIGQTVFKMLVAIMAIFGLFGIILYGLRDSVVRLLFSKEFAPLTDVIVYQLVGDFFRISAYVMGFVAVAKGAFRIYVGAEILQAVLMAACGLWIGNGGAEVRGVMEGYAVAYGLYFVGALIVFFAYLNRVPRTGAAC